MLKRILRILIPVFVVGAGLWGLYRYYTAKVEKEASRLPPSSNAAGISAEEAEAQKKTQRQRLEEALRRMDETRRLNRKASGRSVAPANPVEDVQNTFQTINEINRLNRLNQEMREQRENR